MSPSDRPQPPNAISAAPLPDLDEPPSDAEIRAAEALRRALEGDASKLEPGGRGAPPREVGATPRADDFARSVRAAVTPASLSAEQNRAILERALASSAPTSGKVVPLRIRQKNVALFAAGGAVGLLALAAAVALVVRGEERTPEAASALASAPSPPAAPERPAFAMARSAAELFPEGIPRSGGTTARVDRIASARAQDFRQNQFARWRTR